MAGSNTTATIATAINAFRIIIAPHRLHDGNRVKYIT